LDEVEEWASLRRRGYTFKSIAERYGRNEKTVAQKLREYMQQGGSSSPQNSELEQLKKEREKYKILIELERLKDEWQRLPNRVQSLEETVKNIEEAVLDLMNQFNDLPISNLAQNWTCSVCGSKRYVMVKVRCSCCGHESWWGYRCPEEKRLEY